MKKDDLEALRKEMEEATLPLMRSNLVFGEGDPGSKVLFIGEAPGRDEDIQKRPFVGRAGQLLNKLISEIGWKREDVYITNIVKRRPPDNRDPLPEEIDAYQPYLTRQINIIDPVIIVPLGRFAMNYFLPNAKITRDQGTIFEKGDRLIYPVFHPAAALRGTGVMNEFRASMHKLPDLLSKTPTLEPEPVEDEVTQTSLF